MNPTPTFLQPPPEHPELRRALVPGALIALAAVNIYFYVQVDNLRTDMAKMQSSVMAELSKLRDASSVNSAAESHRVELLKGELDSTRKQALSLSSQAKTEATARAEQLARQLAEQQAAQSQTLNREIAGVRDAANTANSNLNSKIGDVSAAVGNVKSQAASTQAELQNTIAQLKSVQGDLGVQSGLIATNAGELAALKRLGERNYYEFKLARTKQAQRVGDVSLLLKKSDPKRNKYTIEVVADDKLTEKRDKNLNEPVQFYTNKAKQPYEIVVNQVQKDQIVGYLATPKEQASRTAN
jgi:hypothetical protein